MSTDAQMVAAFPRALTEYPSAGSAALTDILAARVQLEPFNAIATAIFVLAVVHTFGARWFTQLAHRVQHRRDVAARARGDAAMPSVLAELLHFLGEVEVVFGLWAVFLMIAIGAAKGWSTATHYLNDIVDYTEALFVVVIMALAMTRPVIAFAEAALRRVAVAWGGSPAAWWVTILTIGPLLGSLITEPAAMTICAVLLARQFYDLEPSARLKYGTLGLLFVNVSIGGTLTHFAAPPILMVSRAWGWDSAFMVRWMGWRAVFAIAVSTLVYFIAFRAELRALAMRPSIPEAEEPDEDVSAGEPALLPVPYWVTAVHLMFIAWTVFNGHYPALFLGGFLFFLGFARATDAYQSRMSLRTPMLVGFFLAALVIHGRLQGWWIAPVLAGLQERSLFAGAALLTAFNDNALITYLATLVPDMSDTLKRAVVEGAVTGGGLTVIANAPNPAGQALLGPFFSNGISPLYLLAGALVPTLLTAAIFQLF